MEQVKHRISLVSLSSSLLARSTLYKLLRCTCLHCFKFRMAGGEVERFRRRLELLSAGRLVEAQALVLGSSAAAKKAGGEMIDEMLAAEAAAAAGSDSDGDGGGDGAAAAAKARAARDALDYDVTAKVGRSGERAARGRGPRDPAVLTAQTLEAMIDTIGELFRKQPAGKCQNCGAHSPAIRREGFSKLFALPLPPKKRAANSVQGTPVLSVLHRLGEGGQAVAQLEEELGAGERHRAASRKRHRDPAPQLFPGPAPGDDTADETKSGGVKGEDAKDDKDGASSSGEEGEEESDEAADSAAAAAAAGQGAGASGGLSGDSPTYLTPTEVREVMRRFWELNEPLLAYVYPADVARRQRRRAGPAGAAAAGNAAARRAQGYLDFFVQTVPVAPNRFRPANKVGEIVYEHPQNTLLSKLVNGDLDLLAAGRAPQEGAAAGAGAAGATPAQSQLGRTLRLWLDMQNSLNALLDSSAADDTHGVSGIRQQLEKKEGLFRKNMMGKRVNFACRSVISPDVYLNGGEIGVPPYFASRLSFPERVTPWNVARLQEAVMAGPGRNPGAVAVEDERGRIVMLRKDKTVGAVV
jgi:DNA-directed RNA polymerase I subunit RPA1